MEKSIFTPQEFSEISQDDILVFGNNSTGTAQTKWATLAREKFDADDDNPRGLQGRSFSVQVEGTTVNDVMNQIKQLLEIVDDWDQNTFYVTDLGVVPGSINDETIAQMFIGSLKYYNIRLPRNYVEIIRK